MMRFGIAGIDLDRVDELDRSLTIFSLFEVPLAALKVFLLAHVGISGTGRKKKGHDQGKDAIRRWLEESFTTKTSEVGPDDCQRPVYCTINQSIAGQQEDKTPTDIDARQNYRRDTVSKSEPPMVFDSKE